MERKRLYRSHKILIQEKDARIREALQFLQARQDEFRAIINLIKEELDVPTEEFSRWKFSEDGQALEKIEEEKPKKEDKKEK